MTGQTNEIQWYIARDGKQHGPLTDIEMRTFVAHSYLRTTDLIWRPGLPEWQPAPEVFAQAFQQPQAPQVAAAAAAAARAATRPTTGTPAQASASTTDFDQEAAPPAPSGRGKRLALAAIAAVALGGGAYALNVYRDPLIAMVGSGSPPADVKEAPVVEAPPPIADAAPAAETAATPPPVAEPNQQVVTVAEPTPAPPAEATPSAPPTVATDASAQRSSLGGPESSAAAAPADAGGATVAAIDPKATGPTAGPPAIDGTPYDARLQKIPVWALIKREYPEWYDQQIAEANRLIAENKSDNEIALFMAKGLVALRRQHAEQALAASPDKLQLIAEAFLAHLKTLRAQSVSACYGLISKGELSPAVVQTLEKPESATGLNNHASAIFEAAIEGAKSPIKHDDAVKTDYNYLLQELSKLGWKDEDLQAFSNPKLLAKREPEQVCKMVQEWFIAHLAVPNKDVRERLIYETLKPVVTG